MFVLLKGRRDSYQLRKTTIAKMSNKILAPGAPLFRVERQLHAINVVEHAWRQISERGSELFLGRLRYPGELDENYLLQRLRSHWSPNKPYFYLAQRGRVRMYVVEGEGIHLGMHPCALPTQYSVIHPPRVSG